MKIKRLQITLPARMKNTAQHDARAIADAVGRALQENGGQAASINLQGQGNSGAVLAMRAAAALPKGGRNGG